MTYYCLNVEIFEEMFSFCICLFGTKINAPNVFSSKKYVQSTFDAAARSKMLNLLCLYYSAIRSLYRHVVCNVPVSRKDKGDRNQLGLWLDSGLIV